MTNEQVLNARDYPCPCGSGRPIINCCVTERVNTTPPLPKTGYSNPKCYAREINDCTDKMSKEHFVSESVLKIIEIQGKQFTIRGAQWLGEDEERNVSIGSIPTKILCERHNNALSELDTVGKKFFEYIMEANSQNEYIFINGDEVERWMLKMLCGYISSGWNSSTHKDWQPPYEWIDILFGSGKLPEESGLYVLKGKDIKTHYHQVGIWLIESDQQGLFNGLHFLIAGFQFLFFIGLPKKETLNKLSSLGWQLHYRPECILIVNDSNQREVHLGLPPRSGFVAIKVTPL